MASEDKIEGKKLFVVPSVRRRSPHFLLCDYRLVYSKMYIIMTPSVPAPSTLLEGDTNGKDLAMNISND